MKAERTSLGLFTGWFNFISYSLQGLCKFGFYEYFKEDITTDLAGEEIAHQNRTTLYLAASASAEVIADVALCPDGSFKGQNANQSYSFASSTFFGFAKIRQSEGMSGFFRGLSPLWMRQATDLSINYLLIDLFVFRSPIQ